MTLNAAFVHFVASASEREASWLATRITSEARRSVALEKDKRRRIHINLVRFERLRSLKKISRVGRGSFGAANNGRAGSSVRPSLSKLTPLERVAWNIIPKRTSMGLPVCYTRVPANLRATVRSNAVPAALLWANGKSDLLEIFRLLELQHGDAAPNLRKCISYFRAFDQYGYVRNRYRVTVRKSDIKRAVQQVGITAGDIVFVHSSLSSVGHVAGGADAVIDALMEVIGSNGTLLMPTNYDNGVIGVSECGVDRRYPPAPPHVAVPWDPKSSPAHTGAIANAFWARKGVLRSRHPTHAVAAWGKLAKEFVKGHEPGTSCCGREGPYGKMVDYDGRFLYFTCTINATTFWHALDDWLDLPYLPNAEVLMKAGNRTRIVKALKYPEGHRSFYDASPTKIELKMQETGVKIRRTPLGLSDLKLVKARDHYNKLFPTLQREADLFLCDNEGCTFCAWARRIAVQGQWPLKHRAVP